MNGDILEVRWSDGHVSEYDDEWLWDHRLTGDAARQRQHGLPSKTWGMEMNNNMHTSEYNQV